MGSELRMRICASRIKKSASRRLYFYGCFIVSVRFSCGGFRRFVLQISKGLILKFMVVAGDINFFDLEKQYQSVAQMVLVSYSFGYCDT